ncbi:serine threonine- phosphatase 6 regulatory ankyrin repeat subunit b [Fusarium longipes]|uniref:Serine threonine-phosphatase 6 regulatory ankyrin repeat subunit b n=1 Tax=Fusarium longipes TaxID=694270 RepID=A0A395SWX8_9HYPO|nr:serine threonine- phosphatase 6 regulatory ankyrin repeat subunit b [Fusarium longipes]
MASLTSLPPEILLQIIDSCITSNALSSLAQTSQALYTLITPLLYKRQLENADHHVTFHAAKHGNLQALKNVYQYMTLQVYKCSKGNYDTGAFGAEKQRRNGWFWTPLHEAVRSGNIETVLWLIDHGVDINAPSLHFHDIDLGITEGRYHIDFGDRLSFHMLPLVTFSPLITSIYHRHQNITELLLSRGASIHINDVRKLQPCGTTALHVAVINANIPALRLLIEGGHAGPNDLDAAGFPPLVWAALNVSADEQVRESIKILVEHGADLCHVMPCDPWLGSNHNMVTFLTKRGKPDAAHELINFGAPVDPINEH